MKFINDQAAEIRNILQNTTTIAVVGLSPKPSRPSNQVAQYLKNTGYTIIPVNPGQDNLLGLPCYPNLQAIPGPVDMVDIFRRSEFVLPVVEEAITIKAKVIWMQSGIINEEAAELAKEAGLTVIMDRCTMVDHMDLL
jgi:predicted CoA-binding protein